MLLINCQFPYRSGKSIYQLEQSQHNEIQLRLLLGLFKGFQRTDLYSILFIFTYSYQSFSFLFSFPALWKSFCISNSCSVQVPVKRKHLARYSRKEKQTSTAQWMSPDWSKSATPTFRSSDIQLKRKRETKVSWANKAA